MRSHSLAVLLLLPCGAAAQDWEVLGTIGYGEHTMVHDPVRDRLVMFAYTPEGPKMLEWDGESWLQTWIPNGPASTPQRVPRLGYDQARRETVLLLDYRTWRYDGTAWQLAATTGPGGIGSFHDGSRGVTAYDEARQLIVVYDAQFAHTTSEWDGLAWRTVPAQMGVLTSPWAFCGYDPVRQKVVGFTPLPGGAFEWDGTAWNQIAEVNRPAGFPLRQPALCTDPVRNRLFLFGGLDSNNVADNRLWQWDGSSWTHVGSGPALHPVTMAGHVGSGMIVLFGYSPVEQSFETWGYDGSFRLLSSAPCMSFIATDPVRRRIVGVSCRLGNTSISPQQSWEWNGAAWQKVGATHTQMTGMVFDATRGVVLGIESNLSQPDVRTWFWTASGWQRQFPPVDPPWQPRQALCHDPVRGVVVMFGFGGTWEWNGTAWTQQLPAHTPLVASSTAAVSAAFDAAANVVRLVVRSPGGNQEWTWDGNDWQQQAAAGLPQDQYFELAVDSRSGRMLLPTSAGTWERTATGWQQISSAWIPTLSFTDDPFTGVLRGWQQGSWVGFTGNPAEAASYGNGCGVGAALALAALGRSTVVGDDLRFDLLRAPPNAPAALYAGFVASGVPLGGGCTLWVDSPVHWSSASTSATGAVSFAVAIPDDPGLLGLELFWQAAALQAGGPLLGVAALTNGVRVRLGD